MPEDAQNQCNRNCDPPTEGEEPREGVKRRQLLQLGAAAGVATVGAACAPVGKTPWAARRPAKSRPLSESEMKRYVAKLDKGLATIDKGSMLDGVAAGGAVAATAAFGAQETLARKAVRTLYFTGMFNDLPEENQRHPEMQKRLQQQTPEIDETLFTMTAYLGSQSADELTDLQRTLKKSRDTGPRISESLNATAKKMGVSIKRRAQARTMLTTSAWRMQSQPPSLVIDEYVKKVQKVAARQGQSEELKRYFANRVGDAAFWKHQRVLAQAPPAPNTAPPARKGRKAPAAPPAGKRPAMRRQATDAERPPPNRARRIVKSWPSPPRRPALEPEAKKGSSGRPGDGSLKAGYVLLGITGALGAVGGGMCASPAWLGGAVILTVGAITLLIGLICLIVGAAKNQD